MVLKILFLFSKIFMQRLVIDFPTEMQFLSRFHSFMLSFVKIR